MKTVLEMNQSNLKGVAEKEEVLKLVTDLWMQERKNEKRNIFICEPDTTSNKAEAGPRSWRGGAISLGLKIIIS